MTAISIFHLSRRYHHLLSGLVNDRFFRKSFQKDTLVPLTVRRKPLSVKIQKIDMIDHFVGQLDVQKLRIDIARKQQSLIGCFPGIPLQVLLKYHQPQYLLRHGLTLLDKVLQAPRHHVYRMPLHILHPFHIKSPDIPVEKYKQNKAGYHRNDHHTDHHLRFDRPPSEFPCSDHIDTS